MWGWACVMAVGGAVAQPLAPPGEARGGPPERRSALRQAVESERVLREVNPMPERRLSPQEHTELREQLRLSAERRHQQGRR